MNLVQLANLKDLILEFLKEENDKQALLFTFLQLRQHIFIELQAISPDDLSDIIDSVATDLSNNPDLPDRYYYDSLTDY